MNIKLLENKVLVKNIIKKFDFKVINEGDQSLEITSPNLYQIGYELTGFFEEESEELNSYINICGNREALFLENLSHDERIKILDKYFSHSFPVLILSNSSIISKDLIEIARKYNKTILKSKVRITECIRNLKFFLSKIFSTEKLYEEYVLLEIHGIGVLIHGDNDSKIGVTIELLERGHRIITDKNVLIKRFSEHDITGYNNLKRLTKKDHFYLKSNTGHKIDVTEFFGTKSTRKQKQINFLVVLEKWDSKKFYDRLGVDKEYEEILGEKVLKLTLPVRRGRNLSVIIEAAALNFRLKRMGINSAEYFLEETKRIIQENKLTGEGNNMNSNTNLSAIKLINEFELKVILGEDRVNDVFISSANIFRPSLALAGHGNLYTNIDDKGIQVFSNVEFNFLNSLDESIRNNYLDNYLTLNFPLFVVTQDTEIPEYFIQKLQENNCLLCRSKYKKSSLLITNLNTFLEGFFSPSVVLHGVFVELYSLGVLLTGKSGIGKSESALELIHKGHRLIADDYVTFSKDVYNDIIGEAAKLPYFMEIRGLGIIDIKSLYGLRAVRITKRLDIIIELREQESEDYTASLSYTDSYQEILGRKLKKIVLYISSGRNAATMIEIAVMKELSKALGYDSDKAYKKKIDSIEKNYETNK